MKKIINFLTLLIACIILTSCMATVQAQTDNDVDAYTIITYGVPHYNANGLLLYYIYNNMCYYPYYYNNRYYLHRYPKPIPRDFNRHEPRHRHHTTSPNENTHIGRRPTSHNNNVNKSYGETKPNTIHKPNGGIRPNNSQNRTRNRHSNRGGR